MKAAIFRFGADLEELLPRSWRRSTGIYCFAGPQSAKHLIEALGIPHTEVGAIVVNGIPSGLAYLVREGDDVQVQGARDATPLEEPRFVIDGHLGRLNARLRMLGFDCAYRSDWLDSELADLAVNEDRILLTRDRRLLMRKTISKGYLVRALHPTPQLHEVTRHFGLRKWTRPFRRCIRCNAVLEGIEKQAVSDRLEPLTRLYFDEFRICPSCAQIYWKGSHVGRMQMMMSSLDIPGPDQALD
ncbi:MAG: Mut7-C RNAse domain-containing protein [Chloroflexota bacterium]